MSDYNEQDNWPDEQPSPKFSDDKERAALIAIRDAIHERDGIVLGVDPIGRRCSCAWCQKYDGGAREGR